MKNLFRLIFLCFMTTAYAVSSPYRAIIEVQGSSAQLHLFKNDAEVHEIYSKNVRAPSIENALKTVLDATLPQATSGPILLDIYSKENVPDTVKNFIQDNYSRSYQLNKLSVLTEDTKIFYDWISVNYLAKTFQTNEPLLNVVDINENSTAIAYSSDQINHANAFHFYLNNQHYQVISQSFTELGFFAGRRALLDDAACYPPHYPLSTTIGQFDLPLCRNHYMNWIQSIPLLKNPISTGPERWVVFSEAATLFNFFEISDPDKDVIESRINWVCLSPWEDMRKEYEGEDENRLATLCANAIFANEIIHSILKIPTSRIWPTTKIRQQKIDWPLGAAVFENSLAIIQNKG